MQDQDDESIPRQARPVTAVNWSNWRRSAIAIVIIALVTGTSGYLLGIRVNQNASQSIQRAYFQPSPIITAQSSVSTPSPGSPQATATPPLKIYRNERFGFSFKYPEVWFPQEVSEWNPPGESINFYPNGITPDPGEAGRPTNAVLNVELSSFNQQTNEQFISMASQTTGYQKILNVAGKPAIKTKIGEFQQYYIKLSNTRELILTTYNEDGNKKLNTIISSIKFASE